MPEGAVPAPEPADLEVEMDAIQWPWASAGPATRRPIPSGCASVRCSCASSPKRAPCWPGRAVAHRAIRLRARLRQTTFWN